ncbi:hypothetical protein VAJ50_19680 [Klebsiella pneumoniae]|uniref:hypothetical protein n=1 Tax=Klebsiella pneumoniae TaxID=573 RepID=UPI0030161E32
MTKSTIPRKQLIKKAQEQIEFCRHTKITGEGRAHVNQCAALFEIALAAMNGEPVTWGNGCDKTVPAALRYLAENERPFGGESRFNAAHLYQLAREIELMAEAPLYRHAQPVPVVPKSIGVREAISALESADAVTTIGQAYKMGWNHCRAAMLQELQKSAGAEVICRSNENVQAINTIKATPALGSFPKTGEVQNTNPPENPGCWCRTCRPVVLNDMRFVVCPDCGNKRCPRANDHRNACTGSNEPGQEGGAYPDTPQEVKP